MKEEENKESLLMQQLNHKLKLINEQSQESADPEKETEQEMKDSELLLQDVSEEQKLSGPRDSDNDIIEPPSQNQEVSLIPIIIFSKLKRMQNFISVAMKE